MLAWGGGAWQKQQDLNYLSCLCHPVTFDFIFKLHRPQKVCFAPSGTQKRQGDKREEMSVWSVFVKSQITETQRASILEPEPEQQNCCFLISITSLADYLENQHLPKNQLPENNLFWKVDFEGHYLFPWMTKNDFLPHSTCTGWPWRSASCCHFSSEDFLWAVPSARKLSITLTSYFWCYDHY